MAASYVSCVKFGLAQVVQGGQIMWETCKIFGEMQGLVKFNVGNEEL